MLVQFVQQSWLAGRYLHTMGSDVFNVDLSIHSAAGPSGYCASVYSMPIERFPHSVYVVWYVRCTCRCYDAVIIAFTLFSHLYLDECENCSTSSSVPFCPVRRVKTVWRCKNCVFCVDLISIRIWIYYFPFLFIIFALMVVHSIYFGLSVHYFDSCVFCFSIEKVISKRMWFMVKYEQ